ncbi:hypothetical protein AYO44_13315 [Planctomycetaceae bacterium SCGC AG-212-F19]|nr:hypothetical protein AYO44_13315 [Planctomycetaceae bacterium SCGC AG-212-F19]
MNRQEHLLDLLQLAVEAQDARTRGESNALLDELIEEVAAIYDAELAGMQWDTPVGIVHDKLKEASEIPLCGNVQHH